MIVNAAGEMSGSLGGGIMEHKFVEMARDIISTEKKASAIFKQVHDKAAARNQSGMICSGEQIIFLYLLKSTDKKIIEALIASLEKNENATIEFKPGEIIFHPSVPDNDFLFEQNSDENFLYREKTGYKNILHIIGGGHCSLALSKLMAEMDFYIHVYDDRPQLHTMQHNKYAHQQHIVQYGELQIKEGNNIFVVIMTVGYRTDDMALRTLKGKHFGYLGLLGSSKKIEKMMNEFKAEGINHEWLSSIHSPIGIDIKSETPEEIAVSIAAEIIREKNKVQL